MSTLSISRTVSSENLLVKSNWAQVIVRICFFIPVRDILFVVTSQIYFQYLVTRHKSQAQVQVTADQGTSAGVSARLEHRKRHLSPEISHRSGHGRNTKIGGQV